jgi:hypothetical protein
MARLTSLAPLSVALLASVSVLVSPSPAHSFALHASPTYEFESPLEFPTFTKPSATEPYVFHVPVGSVSWRVDDSGCQPGSVYVWPPDGTTVRALSGVSDAGFDVEALGSRGSGHTNQNTAAFCRLETGDPVHANSNLWVLWSYTSGDDPAGNDPAGDDPPLRPVRPGKLKANAGKDMTVRRGKTVTFDGSQSTGRIKSYRWTYELGRGCPKELSDPKVKDNGAVVTATLLCSVTATLKVTGASGKSRTDKVEITVKPRKGPRGGHQ